jgi:DNA-binding transcriptional regulator YiaG
VYLLSGYELVSTPEGDGITIQDLDGLHKAIGLHLVTERKVLSSQELRYIRKQMDFTQSELGKLLGLTDQQVARWEKGTSEITDAADTLLRLLYLEHAGANLPGLREMIERLEQLDAEREERQVFKETSAGWLAIAA